MTGKIIFRNAPGEPQRCRGKRTGSIRTQPRRGRPVFRPVLLSDQSGLFAGNINAHYRRLLDLHSRGAEIDPISFLIFCDDRVVPMYLPPSSLCRLGAGNLKTSISFPRPTCSVIGPEATSLGGTGLWSSIRLRIASTRAGPLRVALTPNDSAVRR